MDRAGTSDVLPADVLDRLAEAIHAAYLADRAAEHRELGSEPALRPWSELPEHLRDANRAQAAGYVQHLASLGYAIVPAAAGHEQDLAVVPREDLERLARAEHDRWVDHKVAQGYRYGVRRVEDGPRRFHPSIVPWEDLPEDVRERDRQPLRRMLAQLSAADMRVVHRSG